MDVNKPERVATVGDQPHRSPSEHHHDQSEQDPEDQARQERYRSWSADAAVDLAGALSGSLSPEIQRVLNAFAAQIDPLRAELDGFKAREAHFKDLAARHSFLPLPNRREFFRELAHVIEHMESPQPPPALVCMHAAGIEDVRRRFGRHAADNALIEVSNRLEAAIHPTDAAGSLGGADFAVILLLGDGDPVNRRVDDIRRHITRSPLEVEGQPVALDVALGCCELRQGWSPEQAVAAADRDLRARLRR